MYLLVKFCVNYLLCAIFKIPMILCEDFIARAGTIPQFSFFCGSQIIVSGNFGCIFLLWRRKKLVLSPHRELCQGSRQWRRKHPNFLIARRRAPCLRVRMPNVLGVCEDSPLGCGWGPSVNYRMYPTQNDNVV